MPGRQIVTAPDGVQWRVGRRWLSKPPPRPWRRWRRGRSLGDDAEDVTRWSFGVFGDFDVPGLLLAAAVAVLLALAIFVLLPLLGIALEVVLLAFVLTSGLCGRVVLRRPWTIEAVCVADPSRRAAFAVTGWGASQRTLDELASAIALTGPPSALPEAEPVVTAQRTG